MIFVWCPSQVIDSTFLTKRIFTSDIGVRGQLGDKVTLTPVSMAVYDKIENTKLEPNGSAAVVRYRSNIG
jgi:Fe(3+) dicitrate transport protein